MVFIPNRQFPEVLALAIGRIFRPLFPRVSSPTSRASTRRPQTIGGSQVCYSQIFYREVYQSEESLWQFAISILPMILNALFTEPL